MGGEMTDLAAIRARVAAATPGPWATDCEDGLEDFRVVRDTAHYRMMQGTVAEVIVDRLGQDDNEANDAELIAHAPTDLLALCAEVERLRAEVAALKDGGGK